MRNEVGLTPATKKLWENRPAEFQYPERDLMSRNEIKWDLIYRTNMMKQHLKR